MASQMSDQELVLAARAGEAEALAELYDRYFAPLYDFLARMLRDRHAAADVAQDSFVRAIERLDQLRKPAGFRSWLFSIAYRLGLDHAGGRAVPAAPDDPVLAEVDTSSLDDPARAAGVAETGRFVWEMAAGLDAKSYSVMHLHVRLGLSSAEIAGVLGVSKGNAYTMVSRMKSTLAESIGAYLLLRRGTEACPDLAAVAAAANVPPMTREVRRRVDRHARACDTCTETKAELLAPSAIFGLLVMVPLPAALPGAVLGAVSTAAAGGAAGAAGATTGSGIAQAARNNPGATAGVAAAAVLAAVVAAFQLAGGGEPPAQADVLGVTVEREPAPGEAPLAASADPALPPPPAGDTMTSTSPPATAAEPTATATGAAAATTSSTTTTTTTTTRAAAATTTTTTSTVPAETTTTTAPATTTTPSAPATTTTTTPSTTTAPPITTTTTAPPPTTTTTAATTTTTTTVPPATNPTDVSGGTHQIGVPSTQTVVVVRWTPVNGASGYSVSWSGDPTGSPDTTVDLPGSAGQATSPVLSPGSWYFHLRTRGPGGDWAATVHVGPFVIVAPAAPPVIGAVSAAPPTISELGCSPSATSVVATGVGDPDGDLATAVLRWAIDGAGSGSIPMDLGANVARATLGFPASAIGPLQSPAAVTLTVALTDTAGLTATAKTLLVLVDCP